VCGLGGPGELEIRCRDVAEATRLESACVRVGKGGGLCVCVCLEGTVDLERVVSVWGERRGGGGGSH